MPSAMTGSVGRKDEDGRRSDSDCRWVHRRSWRGFGAGWGLKPDQTAKALEAQAQTLKGLSEGQVNILDAAQRPVVLDAELKSQLAEVPVQCRKDLGETPPASRANGQPASSSGNLRRNARSAVKSATSWSKP